MFLNKNRFFMVLFNISIAFLLFSCQSKVDVNIETYKVTRGEFLSSVTETGELAAINSQLISAPNIDWRFGQLKVVQIVEDGTQVQPGDTLAAAANERETEGIVKALEAAAESVMDRALMG